ncbi:MAG TPA: hypothetical protein VI542_29960 [Candidatus Tectomicrobia bacterium]
MDRNDERGARRLRINDIPLPQTCEICGGNEFEASTTAGRPALHVKLPVLRCTARTCQQVYAYDRGYERWATVSADSTIAYVPLEDLDPYKDQWC